MNRPMLLVLASLLLGGSVAGQDEARIKALVADLGSEDYATRTEAERALEAIGEAARPFLEEAAKSSDPEVRLRAGRLLVRLEFLFLKDGAMAEWDGELVDQFLAADPGGRALAAGELLERIVEGRVPRAVAEEALAVLSKIKEGGDPGARRFALILLGDAEAIRAWGRSVVAAGRRMPRFDEAGESFLGSYESLAEAMKGAEGRERVVVGCLALAVVASEARASEEVPDPAREALLAEARRLDPAGGPEVSFTRGGLEVRLGDLAGLPLLLVPEAETDPWLERILAPYREPAARRRLLASAGSLDPGAKARLAGLIMGWYAEDPPEAFEASFADPSPCVREFAALAVGFHGIAAHREGMGGLLDDPVYEVRLSAAWSLVQIGARDEGVAALRKALASGSDEEVRDAIWSLVSVEDPEVGKRALDLLDDPRPDVRAAAVYALAQDDSHLEAIAERLGDEAECRFYASPHSALAKGTVGGAARAHLECRLGSPLPEDEEAAREEVRRRAAKR